MPTKLFVGNISESCSEEDLKDLFEKYGKIVEHAIIRNYGFVHFENKEDADKAMKELNETELKGNVIRVQLSNTPHKKGRGGGDRDGRGPPGYARDRARPGSYPRGAPSWGHPQERGGGRYHPYSDRPDYYRPPYPPDYNRGSSAGGQYGYYSTYDSDSHYSSREYPYASSSSYSTSYFGDRYGGPVTYPDVTQKRQQPPPSWDRYGP